MGNQHAKALEVRNNCELKGHNNLYLVDGSTIKDLDNKFPTEIIMINAYRVGIVLSKKIKMNKYIKISISSLVLVFFITYNFEAENFSYEVFNNVDFSFLVFFFYNFFRTTSLLYKMARYIS